MQKLLILDMGGRYGQLLTRRVRGCHVFCELRPAGSMTADQVRQYSPIGIILVGNGADNSEIDPGILELEIPVLGIGSGCLLLARLLGGRVSNSNPVCGRTLTKLREEAVLFAGMPGVTIGWMDCSAVIDALPEDFVTTASSDYCPIAAFSCPQRQIYGTLFHPEVGHTEGGERMLRRFLTKVCGADESWTMENIIAMAVKQARQRIGKRRVLLALSGGVDSSVVGALLSRAVGDQLTCIFVDNGLLRKNEPEQVEAFFSRVNTHFVRVDAAERFVQALRGVCDPEEKRRVIGEEFACVFQEEAQKLGGVDFLAQGTIYPDIMETCPGYQDVLPNRGSLRDLPDRVMFKELIEPLRYLFKDEVRQLGRTMGLPEFLVDRQPFPGPGLAIRIVGEVLPEKLELLRQADHVFASELEKAHMHQHLGQYFAVLTDTQSDGGYVLALRAVTTDDFFTAKWARIPYELLDKISQQILREVPGIARIVYDITGKPPASIEWE